MDTNQNGIPVFSSDEARTHWRDILDIGMRGGDVVVERYGKPVVAVIPYEDYEALIDALDDLRDGRLAAVRLAEWERDPSVARPYEDIRAEMVAEGRLDD
jgi:prevent-host-death family protein